MQTTQHHFIVNLKDSSKAEELLRFLGYLDFVESVSYIDLPDASEADNEISEEKEEEEPSSQPLYYTPKIGYTVEDMQAIADQFPADKKWTYSNLLEIFPPNLKIKVEILQNQLFITQNPTPSHQILLGKFLFQLIDFTRKHQPGQVFKIPLDTKLDEDNVVQPDILFISPHRYKVIEEMCINGAPDMALEIWLPTESQAYRQAKHQLYERQGVTEFWQIYPKKQHITIEVLDQEGKYPLFSEAKKEGTLRSKVLEGFEIDIQTLMSDKFFEQEKKKNKRKTKNQAE